MKKKEQSYDEAYLELSEIVRQLQSDTVGIDQLSKLVERATVLQKFCKEKLREIETTIQKVSKD